MLTIKSQEAATPVTNRHHVRKPETIIGHIVLSGVYHFLQRWLLGPSFFESHNKIDSQLFFESLFVRSLNPEIQRYSQAVMGSQIASTCIMTAKASQLEYSIKQASFFLSRCGSYREKQNWLGESLETAVYVPPKATLIADLMTDWSRYVTANVMPKSEASIHAFIAECELLNIHPFLNGNGRISRFVTSALLKKTKLELALLPLYQYTLTTPNYYRILSGVRNFEANPYAASHWYLALEFTASLSQSIKVLLASYLEETSNLLQPMAWHDQIQLFSFMVKNPIFTSAEFNKQNFRFVLAHLITKGVVVKTKVNHYQFTSYFNLLNGADAVVCSKIAT